ncbi:hypothetical protein C8A05DRAFT_13069 [Staphylotrichum tortipilum]|uniref:BZIP domain-containing protein n=1 Tax=Staphylotrichum tortipilum TaxID=2831512 RepID=A0AAN6MSB6_9PEZI|nr:hypothetical protein C8A05DRAFT_13069 [Staphylotrichum longicolle]
MSVDKNDPSKEDSEDSMESSPEGDAPAAPPQQQAESQQPKRKGGRKPIYATSEERKQRNRQAQAAFRERRTEYIKQLEEAIRTHEQNLANLQAAHRHAADECLMLRYKNSLLERILLEKGIDVQAELRAKTGSPNLGPTHVPQNLVQPPPIQRAILNRHHARRSASGIAPKLEPGIPVSPLPPPMHAHPSALSPKNRHTPSSHSASPSGTASFGSQHGASPAGSDHPNAAVRQSMPPMPGMKAAPPPQHLAPLHGLPGPRQMQMPNLQQQQQQGTNHVRGSVASTPAAFYPTPSFQNHIEQLGKLAQQEYDAAADMMDDGDAPDTPSGPGPYPGPAYAGEPQSLSLSTPVTTGPPGGQPIAGQSPMENAAHTQHPTYPSMTQLLDPNYDFDPFGLSASMAFPTQFSFDTSNMR